jgi:light-regulated signal transduction histidine kinase (bacteriophytochrome)
MQLLQRRYEGKLDERADTYIRFAVDGADHMRGLVNGLLEYSRVNTRGQPATAVSLEDTLADARRSLAFQIEETGAEITHDPLPDVLADSTQVFQLLQNLLTNSLRFRSEAPPRIHLSAQPNGDRWRLSLRDNGIGIEPPYLDRIFGVFQRLHTREEYPGTGIGLSICRRIVERHGGTIRAESGHGEGAMFVFSLPGASGPGSPPGARG